MRPAIAQYYPGDSVIHRLDARAKFVAVTALAVALFGLGVALLRRRRAQRSLAVASAR